MLYSANLVNVKNAARKITALVYPCVALWWPASRFPARSLCVDPRYNTRYCAKTIKKEGSKCCKS